MQAVTSPEHDAFDLNALGQALHETLLPYSLLRLPLDVIRLLIVCLDGRSILSLSNSCKRFRQIVEGDPKLLNLTARKLHLPVSENDPSEKVLRLLRLFKAVEHLESHFFQVNSLNPPSIFIYVADYQETREKIKKHAISLAIDSSPCPFFEELKKPLRPIEIVQLIAARALAVLPQGTYITLEQLTENCRYTLFKGDEARIDCIQHVKGEHAIKHIAQTMRECKVTLIKKRRSPEPNSRL